MTQAVYCIRNLLLPVIASGLILLSGCSTSPEKSENETPAQYSVDSIVRDDVTYAIDIYDPWEGFNRGMYHFNAAFDRYIFLPVVKAYTYVTPNVVEDSVSNIFSNLFEINNLVNSILQLKPTATLETTERFLINSTVGLAGIFDVASKWGIYEHDEDFGQTLGHYGVGEGPYIVLPIAGPSNLRDTTGLITDSLIFTEIDILNLDDHNKRKAAFYLLNAIDRRHRTGFRYYDSGSPFEYELIRLMYTEKRKLDIAR
ncbi:MAG: VacJ family lipoprotein [Porticoccus sp.]|nr:VacJ family lipoprotein [Porticoccus sp.]MBQ0808512.1 VacJ family lipoprotein [Porticoccus sp.]